MLSALLRSGDVKNYTALGQDGTPVYAVAPQLRDAIKFRVKEANNKNIGKKFANYLAIPQRNDQGSQIDWYVPFESERPDGKYMIIPWTSATEEERAAAFAELNQFEQAMLQFGLNLKNSDNLQGDLLLFSRLLCGNNNPADIHDAENLKALRFPSPEYVYLVNNRPVITFWGFVEKNADIYGNPFLSLQPVMREPTAVPVVEPEPVVIEEKKPWWRWLLWLLPFLLFGLLALFFLRSCWAPPKVALTATSADASKIKLPSLEREACVNGVSYRFSNHHWFELANNHKVTDGNLIKQLNHIPSQQAGRCEGVNVDPTKKVVGTDIDQTVVNTGDAITNTPISTDNTLNAAADNVTPLEGKTHSDKVNGPDNPGENSEKTGANESRPQQEQAVADKLKPQDVLQQRSADSQTNQPLHIPEESAKNGNVDFLNGQWNAGAGIQDKSTGKPLRLKYEFEKGKGQVRVERGDGVQCVGDVKAAMQGGSLSIGNTGIAKCSDGSTYQLPDVKCKPDASGSADCEGEYGRGQRFPMSMKTN